MNPETLQAQKEFNTAAEKLFALLDSITLESNDNLKRLEKVTKQITEFVYGLQKN